MVEHQGPSKHPQDPLKLETVSSAYGYRHAPTAYGLVYWRCISGSLQHPRSFERTVLVLIWATHGRSKWMMEMYLSPTTPQMETAICGDARRALRPFVT